MKSIVFLFFCLFLFFWSSNGQSERLLFDEPARYWEETLPLGNGRLGMMPDGGVEMERIVLNDITLWSGTEADYSHPEALESLPAIRQLLLEGKNDEAQQLMYQTFTCGLEGSSHGQAADKTYGCFQTLGNIDIQYHYPANELPSDYQRQLCLNNAVATTEFKIHKTRYQRTYFVSRDADVGVVYLQSSRKGGLSLDVRLNRPENAVCETETDALVMHGQLPDGLGDNNGMKFYAKLKVKNEGGTVEYIDHQIVIRNAQQVCLLFSAATDYFNADFATWVDERLREAETTTYATLKKEHETAYRRLFDRVTLHLAGDQKSSKRTVHQRLTAFQSGNDPALAALYFQYGRYLFISSTRENLLPPNLQGLWANSIQTPWNGDYHLNINVQMNHWLAEVGNLPELHLPLVAFTERLAKSGAKTARDFYGVDGWVAHSITNLWGFTAPGEHPSWGATNTGGAWLCLHLWQHYRYAPDSAYLQRIYPVMRDAARFFHAILIEEPQHGWLVTAPTTSPENIFRMSNGATASVCMGSTMDVQIITELFNAVVAAAELLDCDAALTDTLQQLMKRFPPQKVSNAGYLEEWLEDYEEVEVQHRHVSHLFGLHPGSLITPTKTPALCTACETVLERRGDGGTGWSRAWKINFWARLGNGNRAYTLLKKLLEPVSYDATTGGTYPNLLCAHPPFQIDGNFGAAAGIAEMLLQSHDGYIHILPALPDDWKSGSYKGLCAENGAVVDCRWKNGKVKKIRIYSKTGSTYLVKIPSRDDAQPAVWREVRLEAQSSMRITY